MSAVAAGSTTAPVTRGAGRREFVGLIAACMGMTALGIDSVLPAFGELRTEFGLDAGSTVVSWVITGYFLGLASGQLFYGPLSDRFGRRPVLIGGMGLYVFASAACMFAESIEQLIAARFFQVFGSISAPVLARAMVRDLHEREAAARILAIGRSHV